MIATDQGKLIVNYSTIEREAQQEEDTSVPARLERLAMQYKESGMRRSAEALMVVMHQGVPHVMVTRLLMPFISCGYLDPSESFEDGLITRLEEQLGIPQGTATPDWLGSGKLAGDWKAGECITTWYRPNFDTFFYPYLPPQHTQPKEIKKVFIIHLPAKKTFGVPLNMKLHAIPIYELYDNAARYGPLFAGIPHIMSKYPLYLPDQRMQERAESMLDGYGRVDKVHKAANTTHAPVQKIWHPALTTRGGIRA